MRKFYSLTIAILFLFSSNLFSGFLFEDFEFVWTSTPVALPGLTQSPNINIGTGNPDIDALTIIGTGISSTYVYGPIYRLSATSTTDYSRHEYLFVASELSTAGITTGAIINQLYWNKSTTSSSLGDASFKIYMKNSALTALTGGTAWSTIITGATLVYSSTTQTLPGSTGWLLFNLSTPFTYTGGSIELAVDWDCSMIVGNPSTGSYPWYYTSGYPTARTIYSSSSVSSPTTLSSSSTSRPNIQIDYTASVDPYLTVNPTALSFGNVLSGGTSAEMTYSISGGNLAAGPIVVTAPAGFEVSLTSGSGFGSSVDVSYTPPTLTATTIYARFKPTTPNISYSGNITNVGGGASADVAVSGNSYLYVRYCTSNATSSLDEDIFNVTFGTLNNSSTCATTGGIGSVLNRYSNYTTTVSAPDVSAGAYTAFSVQIGTCGGNYSNAVKIFIDFNQDGDFADAGEQVYVSPASTTGPHTETGSILIPCDAITGNTMMRVVNVETSTPSGITACGTYSWGETEDYLVNITPYTAMSYSSSTSTQTLTAPVSPGTVNNQIIGIEVVMNNLCLPLSVTQFDLSTNGSTDPPTDISNAKLWYTGTSSTFATTTQFGSTYSGPNGAFSITGSQALTSGTNYFWLSYDIPSGATLNDYVDAECSNIVINSNNYTPTVTAPAGSRIIQTPLIGTYTVDPFFGNYPSLTNDGGIFAAINGLGLKGNVTIQINGDLTSETGTYALGQWSEFEGSGYTITIKPGSASLKTISGSVANGLIRLDGCDRVTIDGNGGFAGRSGSGSKYLLFRNTNGSNPTITLNNDARSNIIKDCYIESNNSSTSSATILFGTTTGTDGNDSNIIEACDIRDRSDATGFPAYAIMSSGSTGTTAQYNSDNKILGCNIYNFWLNGGFCGGINLSTGTGDNWTIDGNSFYQTGSRDATVAVNGGWNVIFAGVTTINNLTVTNNFVGGSGPGCTGTWTATSTAALQQLLGIRLAAVGSTTASSIQGNTVKNINLQSIITASVSPFLAISLEIGLGNIGTTVANIIGSNTETNNIVLTFNVSAASSFSTTNRGIYHSATGNVNNNIVGGFTIGGDAINTNTMILYLIDRSGTPTSPVTISNNILGSNTVANNVQTNPLYSGGLYNFTALNCAVTTVALTISNNIIANISNNCTFVGANVTFARTRGIYHFGSGIAAISGNTIHDLTNSADNTSSSVATVAMIPLVLTGSGVGQSVTNNTVYACRSTSTSALSSTYAFGMGFSNSSQSGCTMSGNRIYDITNTNLASPYCIGIWTTAGSWTVANNQITLTNGEPVYDDRISNRISDDKKITSFNSQVVQKNPNFENINNFNTINSVQSKNTGVNSINYENSALTYFNNKDESNIDIVGSLQPMDDNPISKGETDFSTNGVILVGILTTSTSLQNYYYNSVYVGGSAAAGTLNSYAFWRTGSGSRVIRNNIFYNARTGGTGFHYAIGNTYSTPATGWSSSASNYNAMIVTDANYIGEWGTGVSRTIDEWRTSSSGDKQTWATTTGAINAANLFTSISAGNLNIQNGNTEAWLVSGKGIAITGQNADFEGNSRGVNITDGCTDIGSDEFSTPGMNPPAATESAPPAGGTTTTYTQWGRTLASIDWASGGSYPSSISVLYFSGVNPPSVAGGEYSNSYTTVTATGSLTGANYDITYYFGDNETYIISSPSTKTVLAKWNPSSWEVFHLGSNPWQTQLIYNTATSTYTTKVNLLTDFSNFALSNDDSPLPVQLSSFTASILNSRNVELVWVTEQEINNAGFDVERRTITPGSENKKSTTNSAWVKLGFVQGAGTTNEQHSYKYTDLKLTTGKYEYRLKQIDLNSNYEYFNLNSPSQVVIGTPINADLSQNYPNPSNPNSKIDYQLPYLAKVTIKVYDVIGREIATLVNEVKEEGYYTAEFDGTNLASGIYFYRIIAEGGSQKFSKTLKMVLVK